MATEASATYEMLNSCTQGLVSVNRNRRRRSAAGNTYDANNDNVVVAPESPQRDHAAVDSAGHKEEGNGGQGASDSQNQRPLVFLSPTRVGLDKVRGCRHVFWATLDDTLLDEYDQTREPVGWMPSFSQERDVFINSRSRTPDGHCAATGAKA